MILGITGPFGCGKSSVLAFFADHNWRVFDADAICREMYCRDDGLRKEVAACWGEDVFAGGFNPKILAGRVFGRHDELTRLMKMIYPRLEKKLNAAAAGCRRDRVNGAFELPLLYEGHFESFFDAVLTVWTSPEVRRRRLMEKRGFSSDEIAKREAEQLAADLKLERADFGVVNSGLPAETTHQLEIFINELEMI
ncbi:MAG: dephospho-CoA kinase [Victivallaceae bacterium]|nr:dephospho-CoA kinase [Victivallaceae bacterium]